MIKPILGILAICFSLGAIAPYLVEILRGNVRPHAFSWLVWGLTMSIEFAAQVVSGAGAGSWATGIGSALCFIITFLSFSRGEKNITRGDWVSLLVCLGAIPLWVVTNAPIYAVLLVVLIDTLGFYPTLRKSWNDPWHESALLYVSGAISFTFVILALESYALVNWIASAVSIVSNFVVVAVIGFRRPLIAKI